MSLAHDLLRSARASPTALPVSRHGSPRASRHLIVLSGNVGAGKSTLGPLLAARLKARWLPETAIAMQFPCLIGDPTPASKLLAEIAFAASRMATVVSSFLSGDRLVVAERGIWDDWIFYSLWRERFSLRPYDPFMRELFSLLETHTDTFRTHTVFLRCRVATLAARLGHRGLPYDIAFSADVLNRLEELYQEALVHNPPAPLYETDVSGLAIRDVRAVQDFLDTIIEKLGTLE